MRKHRMSARHQVYVARIGYFLSGFAVACWAPLIPIIKTELQLSTEAISVLVLAFGLGSVSGMFISGIMLQHVGFKVTYAISTATTAVSICLLALMPSYEVVLGSLIVFGMSIGCLEVAINVFGAFIEKKYRLLLLSVLFAYYSLGEVVGAIMMMALIVAFTYMVGVAILDWSGLYVTEVVDVPLNYASFGYCIVSICMLLCRIYSRPIIRTLGAFRFAFYGAILMIIGLGSLVLVPNIFACVLCFLAIGCGMSNISPLATSAAGQQKNMPLIPAISFVSICGYIGLLIGPACLGFIASTFSLKGVFLFLAALTMCSAFLLYSTRRDMEAIGPQKTLPQS